MADTVLISHRVHAVDHTTNIVYNVQLHDHFAFVKKSQPARERAPAFYLA